MSRKRERTLSASEWSDTDEDCKHPCSSPVTLSPGNCELDNTLDSISSNVILDDSSDDDQQSEARSVREIQNKTALPINLSETNNDSECSSTFCDKSNDATLSISFRSLHQNESSVPNFAMDGSLNLNTTLQENSQVQVSLDQTSQILDSSFEHSTNQDVLGETIDDGVPFTNCDKESEVPMNESDILDSDDEDVSSTEDISEESTMSQLDLSDSDGEDIFDCLRNIHDPPLYEGAPVRLSESYLATLTFAMRHQLSGKAISDLLGLINLHCRSEDNVFKSSLYHFKKFFSKMNVPLIYHHFCPNCLINLAPGVQVCPNIAVHPKLSTPSFFVEIPLVPQIQVLYSSESFYDGMRYRLVRSKSSESHIEDIYDGQLYKEQVENGFLRNDNLHNFSMTWNSDGIPVFKSTKASLWPLFFSVNELPYKMRVSRENLLLGGLWFGSKPNANLMLKPVCQSLQEVYNGFSIRPPGSATDCTARGILLVGTCDLPAKAIFMCMKQYNGTYGCHICKYVGDKVSVIKKQKKKRKKKQDDQNDDQNPIVISTRVLTVFKYSEILELRRHEETIVLGEQALSLRGKETDIYGVKSPSLLFKIMPDAIRGMAIDDLHTLYLGVQGKLMNFWFKSQFSDKSFSLRKLLPLIEERFLGIRPPNFVPRGIRKISDNEIAHWKGNEHKNFLLHYSLPIFDGIMPEMYFENYADFVIAIHKLSSLSISPHDLLESDRLLHRFVKGFQTLYGERYMSMVIHLLLHLVYAVNNLGPLWTSSCFPFESFNGTLLKMVHGTRYVQTQVASCAYVFLQLEESLKVITNLAVKDYCKKTLHPSYKLSILEKIGDDMYAVGDYKSMTILPPIFKSALLCIGIESENKKIWLFQKLKKGPLLYVSKCYTKVTKRVSYVCSYSLENTPVKYGAIHSFLKVICKCKDSCNCKVSFVALVQEANTEPYLVTSTVVSHIFRFSLLKTYVAVPVNNIKNMMFYISISDNVSYISEPTNVFLSE